MCGISGEIVFGRGRPRLDAVRRMTDALAKRGPDGAGIWTDGRVAFGHRRLSIIDLTSAGAQPMVDGAAGLAVVFNGCIYNHRELRRELEPHYRFDSASDTEVVLKAYQRWGEDFVDHLVGMFAIAISDQRSRRVILARDRLGVKPLYLSEQPDRLRFASSLPALLAGGDVDTDIDDVALHHYLSWHSIVPAPRTILRGVRKLPPATVRVVEEDGRSRDRVYWSPHYGRRPEDAGLSAAEWEERVHDALRTAVRRRLVADVPVGVLLSGGLDSSLLVALLAELGHDRTQTFSIGFSGTADQRGDEFVYSDAVARAYGTTHEQIRIDPGELAAILPRAVDEMPEPMSTHDVPAFFLLARSVSEQVKVVQSGQGADEVFAGYAYHQPAVGRPLAEAAPSFLGNFADLRHDQLRSLIVPDHTLDQDVSRLVVERELGRPDAETALDAVLRFDTHVLMPDDPVKRIDSMCMAWGVEARVPFLDQDLVELAATCPPELKASDGGKGVLKSLGRKILPREVVDRRKGYFPVPALRQLDGPVLAYVREVLSSPEARRRGLLRGGVVDRMLTRPNATMTPTNQNVLWNLTVLESWLQRQGVAA
ncbi:N-acetylglutaminylglutamine amidotransferase [Plantibacter sp. VKM Ac-2880]|uniref:N-acetylglutaminylglutamine amidotransferase n=1 Tax=Plantibacter sp. VKM Ac-2880 TaxID=2783827 RepID=UPI00188E6048|nr:N-acetylglutaminylglutamine amidotransferase [Plantibacter sp. VKM Ac-2880]MBF4568597.1 N-acetylglutaminylglutamine amidotransferase [Plantibacter sp. VKM Ac-2880]